MIAALLGPTLRNSLMRTLALRPAPDAPLFQEHTDSVGGIANPPASDGTSSVDGGGWVPARGLGRARLDKGTGAGSSEMYKFGPLPAPEGMRVAFGKEAYTAVPPK